MDSTSSLLSNSTPIQVGSDNVGIENALPEETKENIKTKNNVNVLSPQKTIPTIKKNISPALYSDIEKKLIQYFDARPMDDE